MWARQCLTAETQRVTVKLVKNSVDKLQAMSKILNIALKDIDYQWPRGGRNLSLSKIAYSSQAFSACQEKYR